MDNNLPNDPSNPNNNNSNPPPPFGSKFNPHTNPPDPNNPYQNLPPKPPPQDSSPHHPKPRGRILSEEEKLHLRDLALHKPKDAHGHWITVTENTKYSEKNDPPLVNANISVTNPVTYFKKWVGKFLNNQDIDLRIKIKPFATIGLVISFGVIGATSFGIGRYLFPYSSPIFHRQVVYTGTVLKDGSGQYLLKTSDSNLWKLKPKTGIINLSSLENRQVVITGNLTAEKYLIEVSEIIISDTNPQPITSFPAPNALKILSGEGADIPDQDLLPKLYSALTWEKTQRKALIFTSGRRRIEQEGVYLESAKLTAFPQDFLDYYLNQLANLNFNQTLNSKTPDNITLSYEKDGLYLTFGVENIYSGSGINRKLSGYRAYLEHN